MSSRRLTVNGLTLLIEFVLSFFYGGGQANLESVNQILAGIDAQFSINLLLLLPPVIVMVLAIRKILMLITLMFVSAVVTF